MLSLNINISKHKYISGPVTSIWAVIGVEQQRLGVARAMHSYSVSKRQAPRVSLWRALLTCRSSPDRASPKRATSVKCERVWRCGLCPCRSFSREGVRGRRRRQQQRMDTLLRFQRSSNFFYWSGSPVLTMVSILIDLPPNISLSGVLWRVLCY